MNKILCALAITLGAAGTAQAADCSPSIANGGAAGIPSFADIVVPGGSVLACAGFYTGNRNSGSPADQSLVQGLADGAFSSFGFGTVSHLEQLDLKGGAVDFSTALSGNTLISVHWGNYGAQRNPAGNVTAFYVINAGTALDVFSIATTGGLSNVAVWATSPVPEPSQIALLSVGLLGMGAVLRRRRAA